MTAMKNFRVEGLSITINEVKLLRLAMDRLEGMKKHYFQSINYSTSTSMLEVVSNNP